MKIKRKKPTKIAGVSLHFTLSVALALTGPGVPSVSALEEIAGCVSASGDSADVTKNPCKDATPSLSSKATAAGRRSGAKYQGGDTFMGCQGKSNQTWEKLNPQRADNWGGYWKDRYDEVLKSDLAAQSKELDQAITNFNKTKTTVGKEGGGNLTQAQVTLAEKVRDYLKGHYTAMLKFHSYLDDLKSCQSLSGLTRELSAADYQEAAGWSSSTSKTSVDGKIKCVAGGAETQDYLPCLNAINAYDALFVANAGVETVQQVTYLDKQMDIQQKMQEDTESVTAGMEAQKSNLEAQADIANQKAVFDGARAATLAGVLNSMPTIDKLISSCSANVKKGLDSIDGQSESMIQYIQASFNTLKNKIPDEANITVGAPGSPAQPYSKEVVADALEKVEGYTLDSSIPDQTGGDAAPQQDQGTPASATSGLAQVVIPYTEIQPSGGSTSGNDADSICTVVARESEATLIMNDKARQQMKAAMIAAGLDAAGNLAKAAILNKHADQIGDAINDVESFAPPEFTGAYEDGLFDECTADPDSENCAVSLDGQDVGFTGNTIQISGFDAGVIGGGSDSDIAAAANTDSPTSTSRTGGTAPKIGTGISKADKGGGIENTAAKATFGSGGGRGGGGGGGSPGSVAGPSGGGAGGGAAGEQPSGTTSKSSKITFSGGTAPTKLTGGTRSAMAKKESKVANPFDKLFGKKASGNELSFRNPAAIGKGKGSILEQISRRYTEISKTDRLLKYEKKNE